MANKKIKLERLIKKGMTISLDILDTESWKEMTAKDRYIPRSFLETRNLIQKIFGTKGLRLRKPTRPAVFTPTITPRSFGEAQYLAIRRGHIMRRFEECHEELYARLFSGLSNPDLTSDERDTLEADIDDATPEFENNHETDHFILRWTNSSTHTKDNIEDSSIVEETGEFLETAWNLYKTSFGRTPYLPNDATKMEVIFQNIPGIGVASPPDGPIQFDSEIWVSDPGMRQPVSAHELFHKLQYTFGFRTKHTPSGDYKWFSEGTASWAEVFVWQRVSGSYKILDLFANPDYNLYWVSYRALPYWIFFEARQKGSVNDNALRDFLHKYDALDTSTAYPERVAYSEVIDEHWAQNNVYGQADNFFAFFSRCRLLGDWRNKPTGEQLYPTIYGPDGTIIEPTLAVIEVNLGSGDAYNNAGRVSEFGSDYYRLIFEDDADKEDITINVDGSSTGDFSYYLIWERNGRCERELFPSDLTEDYNKSYKLDLSSENSLLLIISGRGKGGDYSLTASIT
jgi:hypothetical protein